MYARMGALALGVYTGAGNQAALEAMATTRVLEEAEFRAHHPVFHKEDGHFVETTGQVQRTFEGYKYAAAAAGGHH